MAIVGGMLASALLKVVTQQIGSAISGQIRLQGDFSEDFRQMKMALESVEALLKDAERRSIQDASVRLWLRRLTDAMYGISDMFDEFEADSEPAGRKLADIVHCLAIGPKISMAIKMKKMRKELENITNQHQKFSFKTDNNSNFHAIPDERETDSYMEDETLIVGRTEEKRKIIASLSASMTQGIIILPIYGIGGIGKTTLAKLVFNDNQFKDYSQVWIYVSQTFNLNRIGNSIISQLSGEDRIVTERQMIRNRLGQLLTNTNIKRLMIVLDDLWEENDSQLNELVTMLPVIKGGNVVVIVTTRDEWIARKICSVEPYKLLPLSDEMCWDIIKRKSEFQARDDKKYLEQVGKDIAMKCGGVALAAQTLGYMLKPLTFCEWESVRNSDIWNISTPEDEFMMHHNVLACLVLSYKSMLPPLKLCFTYCAFFPKGQKIVEDDLIYQWIAHGFIAPSGVFSARQLGKNYATQLLGMSFLQHSKSSSVTTLHRDGVALFTMHDLVHDLARSIMMEDILEASKTSSTGRRSGRYALLTDSSNSIKLCVASPAKIRSLCFLGYHGIGLRGIAISSAKYIRVLDLSECYIPKLPNCIGKLKQLRYLNAQRVQAKVMPMCMTKLSKLNYLNLHGSLITTLPKSIEKMKCMMHLDLSYCFKIVELPKSFVQLKELVHLDLNNCRSVDVFLEMLLELKELVYLDLSRCHCVKGTVEALGGLTKLQYLDLSGTFLGRKNLSGLHKVMSNLTQLHYLGMSSMSSTVPDLTTVEMSIFIDRISSLPNLEHLKLSNNAKIVTLPESIGSLRKLRRLDLSACKNLERLPECMVEMDCLRILSVAGCYSLDKSILKQTSFIGLSNLVVQCDSRSDLMFQHAAPDKKLKISSLELMKSTEVAQMIEQMGKQRIEKLDLEWNRDDQRSGKDMEVLGKLLPPITLKYFELRGYNSISFPTWMMSIAQYLPNIVEIWMCGLPKCNSLPPFGQLPNLKELHIWEMDSITRIDEGFYGGARAFPLLWEFELRCMERLEEWNTTYCDEESGVKELMGPNLHRLSLRDCPYLKLKPCPPKAKLWEIVRSDNVLTSWGEGEQTCASSSTAVIDITVISSKVPLYQWRLLHYLPALNSLRIEGCSDVTCSSHQIMRGLSSLLSLHLEDNGQAELPQWLGEVTTLQKLDIRGYLKPHAPLETMKQLTSLRELCLFRCGGTTPPQWLGELTSLEELLISDCPELNNLQGSLQQLTSLQLLSVDKCGISSLPECLGNLLSLKRLEIVDCMGIKSLPESIKKLTKLEDLNIIECPELKKWCELKGKKKKLAHIQKQLWLSRLCRLFEVSACRRQILSTDLKE